MFDFDAGKIIIVGVLALIFIPPKDLPRVMRQVGQFVGKMRRMAAEFQGQFMDAMKEADMADLKREAQKLSDAARLSTGLGTIRDLDRQITGALESVSHAPASSSKTEIAFGDAHPAEVETSSMAPTDSGSSVAIDAALHQARGPQDEVSHEQARQGVTETTVGHPV